MEVSRVDGVEPCYSCDGFFTFLRIKLELQAALVCTQRRVRHRYIASSISIDFTAGGVLYQQAKSLNTRASMANLEYGLQGKKQRLTSIFDYDRLDELV